MTTILIVDDEPDIREVIRFALEPAGFSTAEAGSASDMLKAIDNEQPDLILLDWMLPGRSGLELAKQLKRDPETCRSSCSRPESRKRTWCGAWEPGRTITSRSLSRRGN